MATSRSSPLPPLPPTAVPLPSPQPLGPSAWPPPPPPNYPVFSSGPPGSRTHDAVQAIQDSIGRYLIVLLLGLLLAALYVGIALSSGQPAGLGITAFVTCGSTPSDPFVPVGPLQSLAALRYLSDAIAVILFIVTILAWVKWREGIRRVGEESAEYGAVHVQEANVAKEFYSYTVWVWVGFLIVLIVEVVAGGVAVVAATLKGVQSNATFQCTPALVDSVNAQLRTLLIAVSITEAIYAILLYTFATRSLRESIRSLSTSAVRGEVDSATRWIIIGAFLTLGVIGLVFSTYFSLFSLASAALLVFGFWRLRGAYGRWLAQPPPPPAEPGPPSSSMAASVVLQRRF